MNQNKDTINTMGKFMKQSYAASDNVKNARSDTTNDIKQIRNIGAPQQIVEKIKSLESNVNAPIEDAVKVKTNDNSPKKQAPINQDD